MEDDYFIVVWGNIGNTQNSEIHTAGDEEEQLKHFKKYTRPF